MSFSAGHDVLDHQQQTGSTAYIELSSSLDPLQEAAGGQPKHHDLATHWVAVAPVGFLRHSFLWAAALLRKRSLSLVAACQMSAHLRSPGAARSAALTT